MKEKKQKGFSYIEVMVTVAVLSIIFVGSIPIFKNFSKNSDLEIDTEKIVSSLRLVRQRTVSSMGESQWGVYFNVAVNPNEIILFKGSDFTSREITYDEIFYLLDTVQYDSINILDGGSEVVFERLTGMTSQIGTTTIMLLSDVSKTSSIFIDNSGQIGLHSFSLTDDTERGKDSRHVHFEYDREISSSTESIILTFDGSVVETIPIIDNISGSNFYWTGSTDVGGDEEQITIKTLRFNSPDTLFCVYRDRRYNKNSLEIDLDGDAGFSPNLIEYDALGISTQGASIFVHEPIWQ
jgi:prepilin-type N-terminal cleavage/methylation domain-containing protein